jgi:hypothetical protein
MSDQIDSANIRMKSVQILSSYLGPLVLILNLDSTPSNSQPFWPPTQLVLVFWYALEVATV